MTIRALLLAAGPLALSACSPFAAPANNQMAVRQLPAEPAPGPAFDVAVTGGPDTCAFTLAGSPITAPALTERMVQEVQRAVDGAGGVADIQSEAQLPLVNIDAPADTPFTCAGEAAAAVFRAGAPRIRIGRNDGGRRWTAYGLIPGASPPDTMVIMDEGRLTMNGAAVDLGGLRREAAGREGAPPGGIAVTVGPGTTVGAVHDVLGALDRASPALVPPGQPAPVAAPPVIAPPPVAPSR